jgi:uncharacterized damage-inducible protein DinB
MDSQHFVTLFEFNQWANQQILEGVQKLSPEQLTMTSMISHETAYNLVRHLMDAEWSWRLFASGQSGIKYLWETEDLPDLQALLDFWPSEEVRQLEFVKGLSEADLERVIDAGTAQGASPHFIKVWQILMHVFAHATQHRTELSRFLDYCGQPLGHELDFASYVTEVRPELGKQ